MRRANVVKLIVDKGTSERLRELAIATAKCWNEVNWLRMQQFKEGEGLTSPGRKRRCTRSTSTC